MCVILFLAVVCEREITLYIFSSASNLSMMVTMATTGVIVDYLGWSFAFYIPGTLCLVWALLWLLLVSDNPGQHPR